MYRWLVFVHILAVFVFLLAHGGSASVAFRLRRETERARLAALLDLSAAATGLMYASLLVLLVAGIILGFLGQWWRLGWIWTSLALLILTAVGMYLRASIPFNRVRQAAGLPYFDGRREHPAQAPAGDEAIKAAAEAVRPFEVAAMGVVPVALILWLMMFKPF
ncbi:MAG TPA: hypothetical protein VFI11_10505 [Anaerolineales bacterium]|nr:hypothetical protein [Anaerolineales bacterium]